MTEGSWPEIAVMGAGAVGCYFGGLLARAGAPVTLIGRVQQVEALSQHGLLLEIAGTEHQVPVRASTSAQAVRDAQIVLLCVKTLDTEDAARSLVPYLARDAMVVSLQNGVDNVERIRTAAGIDALAAVVYVGAQMSGPGASSTQPAANSSSAIYPGRHEEKHSKVSIRSALGPGSPVKFQAISKPSCG